MANYEEEREETKSFGVRLADRVTDFSGTWYFVIYSVIGLSLWIVLNVVLRGNAFDPYPFILLNLVISIICMLQTPIILIVQRRYEEKDRQRAKHTNSLVRRLDKEIDKLEEMISEIHDDYTKRSK